MDPTINLERESMDAKLEKKLQRYGIQVIHVREKLPEAPITNTKLDLDAINDVNADIRNTERLLEANLRIKKENDLNRKNLRNLLVDLQEKRRKTIFGKRE
jgi:hypothetical protein